MLRQIMLRKIIFPLFLLSSVAFAQGVFAPAQTAFKTVNGQIYPFPGATITVCAANTAGLPCSPALVSTIFADAALTEPLTNPFFAGSNGNYQFAAVSAQYTVTVTGTGFAGYSYQVSLSSGTSTNSVVNNPSTAAQNSITPQSSSVQALTLNGIAGEAPTLDILQVNDAQGNQAFGVQSNDTVQAGVNAQGPFPFNVFGGPSIEMQRDGYCAGYELQPFGNNNQDQQCDLNGELVWQNLLTGINYTPVMMPYQDYYGMGTQPIQAGMIPFAMPNPAGGGTYFAPRLIQNSDLPSPLTAPTTGNAATATAFAATPTLCSTGQAPTGILANGNATGCQSAGATKAFLTSTMSNTFSSSFSAQTLAGLSFSVAASTNYIISCNLQYVVSGTNTGTPNFAVTGPASPTQVSISVLQTAAVSTFSANAQAAASFPTQIGNTGTTTLSFQAQATLVLMLQNGSNAGTVQIKAGAQGTGTVTFSSGQSACTMN